MTPAARVQAAIEILDLIIVAARESGAAADTIIGNWFKTRRFAGSKDRRAVRDLVYRVIRLIADRPEDGRSAMLALAEQDAEIAALFDGNGHGPAAIEPDEAVAAIAPFPAALVSFRPDWLDETECAALLERAPLDLRVNALKADRDAILPFFPCASAIDGLSHGIRTQPDPALEQHPAFLDGRIEVQDAASQHAVRIAAPQDGDTVIDLCAGAGGKTLALAAMMGSGELIACDTDRGRLSRLLPRAERAGAQGIDTRLLNPGREWETLSDLEGEADLVLVDAPCSGSGTWRRNPETRWRMDGARMARMTELQRHVMELGARLVRPGGRLVYGVCSVFDAEGRDQAAGFIDRHPGWSAIPPDGGFGRSRGPGTLFTPAHDQTDGFFVASLQKS